MDWSDALLFSTLRDRIRPASQIIIAALSEYRCAVRPCIEPTVKAGA
jgi:hypothetical protein